MELGLRFLLHSYKPHLVLIVSAINPSIFMFLHQPLLSKGINGLVLVVYEHAISTLVLSVLAFFLERDRRPPLTFQIVCYSFLLGFLQSTLCQTLLTLSQKFIRPTYHSLGVNTISLVTFALAVAFGQEKFQFWSIHGQAKMWGVVVSAMGAMVMVIWGGTTLISPTANGTMGWFMLTGAILAAALWNLLVGHVSLKYPAELSLSATMSFFGSIQTAIITAIFVPRPTWELEWEGGLVLIAILYGGIITTGLYSYLQMWCINKKGPVFTSAFSPLTIVYSFLMETFILKRSPPHLVSFIGAALVVAGLYMLLWGKANDKANDKEKEESIKAPLM